MAEPLTRWIRVADQRSSTRRERVPSRMSGFTFAGGFGDHHAWNKRPQTGI